MSAQERESAKARPASIHVLRVTLADVEPPVWRRIEVASASSLAQLHAILQAAMGWTNSHLHEFVAGGKRYGRPDPENAGDAPMDERKVRLEALLTRAGQELSYAYDFGDDWEHTIAVESIARQVPDRPCPAVTAGGGACPPEDVGGPDGYREFLEALADPRHERHEELREWIGGTFDPAAFDREAANRRLRRGRR